MITYTAAISDVSRFGQHLAGLYREGLLTRWSGSVYFFATTTLTVISTSQLGPCGQRRIFHEAFCICDGRAA